VKKIIPAGAMVEIYGLPGCGKSFLAIHLGMAIARAIPFFGQEVVTPGFVAYIAAEGGHGIEKRIAAYRKYNIIEDGTEPFLLIPQALDLRLVETGDVEALIAELKEREQQCGLPLVGITVDTLNRSFAGGNENSPDDMGKFIQNCDRLGEETGAGRLVIHHESDKSARGGKGGRGHTSLFAATDAVLLVEKNENGWHSFTIERMKDGEAGDVYSFRLDQVELGKDDVDDPVTSLVVEPTEGPIERPKAKRKAKLTAHNQKAFDCLTQAILIEGQKCEGNSHIPHGVLTTSLTLWEDYLVRAGVINPEGNPWQQKQRIRAALAERIGIWNERVWVV
jgi:hypothetical protein